VRLVAWALQILILTAGIHIFLRFVRTTRGNRLIRGLFLSVIVGVVGLWGFSRALGLEELEHLLRSSTGFIVVGFVVIFQSELRRGIAQLGEHSYLRRLMQASDGGAIREVVEAARRLARARRGALIVFERDTPLSPWLESGTAIDAEVRAPLLESLFHPATPLHDGAVIVRKDRIAAAGCILPLSEEEVPSPTMGTRHRAALGISDESDAVVLIVSEETGAISLARSGVLRTDIALEDLTRELGRLVQAKGQPGPDGRGLLDLTAAALRRDLAWLPGSLLLALGIFYIAHQGLQETREFRLRFVDGGRARDKTPRPEEVLVLLAGPNDRLLDPDQDFWVSVTGTRREIEELRGAVRGTLRIDQEGWEGGPIAVEDVRWEHPVGGLRYAWKDRVPELSARRFERRAFQLSSEHLSIDTDDLNPRFRLLTGELSFEPSASVEISGPIDELERLGGSLALELEPLAVSPQDRSELRRRVQLHPELRARELALVGEVVAVVPIVPVERDIGTIDQEIALVCLDPGRTAELERWALPAHARTARFSIRTLGLIPQGGDPASPAMIERFGIIRRFVQENLRVFVDVAELDAAGESRTASVRWIWRRSWRESPGLAELASSPGAEELDVLLESEDEILLEPRFAKSARAANAPGERF
jgi:diadenylate cyclase